MSKKYEIRYLSSKFYEDYPNDVYTEIEYKPKRPYVVVLVIINDNTFAIPFRTNVSHKNSYKFNNSSRNTNSSTGLDFSKAVIVNSPDYIGNCAEVDNKEYIELSDKYYFIIKKFSSFVDKYINFVKHKPNDKILQNTFKYTTLQYFHKELGL